MSFTPYDMRLTPCKHCGRMISVMDEECRFCGTKQKSGVNLKTGIMIAPIVILGLYVFLIWKPWSHQPEAEYSLSESDTAVVSDIIVPKRILTEAEYKAQCEPVDYESVARQPDNYDGKYVTFHGTVIQVLEGSGNNVNYRINQDNDADIFSNDTWIAAYTRPDGEARVLENDTITVFGQCGGLCTYTSIWGQEITIPCIYIRYIDQDATNSG